MVLDGCGQFLVCDSFRFGLWHLGCGTFLVFLVGPACISVEAQSTTAASVISSTLCSHFLSEPALNLVIPPPTLSYWRACCHLHTARQYCSAQHTRYCATLLVHLSHSVLLTPPHMTYQSQCFLSTRATFSSFFLSSRLLIAKTVFLGELF